MGLFGSRKKAKNVPVTSVTEQSRKPEEIEEEIIQNNLDEINEHAQVVERSSSEEEESQPMSEAAASPDPEPEASETGTEGEYEEEDDEIRSFIPFREKPPVTHAIGETKILATGNI